MSTIAFLSDIHANLPALDAVLDDLPDVDEIICLGDVVGYNPWPAECLERVREVADLCLQGNHDRVVETPHLYRANEMAHAGLRLANQQLSDAQLAWLSELPETTRTLDGRALLAHSHPDERDRYVHPSDFEDIRQRYLTGETEVAALGHTHEQHADRWTDGEATRVVFNPGSVGQPRDGDWRAAYAFLDTTDMTVSLERVEYDVVRTQREIHEVGLPDKSGHRLTEGK